ncbi:Fructose-2,6-bisphosphatase [Dinochytrium kinnereticum]|nr:Fructose-2,6-bisphosphatase [Dinochytrium kinnereticum]
MHKREHPSPIQLPTSVLPNHQRGPLNSIEATEDDHNAPSPIEFSLPTAKLAVVMVGLPARGKTYIARKLARYLNWLGHPAQLFNVGNYRREMAGATKDQSFFDPLNEESAKVRHTIADAALDDMLTWFTEREARDSVQRISEVGLGGSFSSLSVSTPGSASPSITASPAMGAKVNVNKALVKTAMVGIYDATNSTVERRQMIQDKCEKDHVEVMFVESICNDPDVVMANIKEVKLSSPDYIGVDSDKAVEDFMARIRHYESTYQTIRHNEMNGRISFVKLIDVGDQVIVNKIRGYIQSRIVYFLMNLNITPRCIYFSRHGESMFNVDGKIGGDSNLSPRGQMFAKKLPHIIKEKLGEQTNLTVWTSTLRRTIQTASYIPFPQLQWKALDELDSGLCDGLTYEEIEEKYPEDFAQRDEDKYNYRYRGGESYADLVKRLEPVTLELERHHEKNHSILIIGHQAVLRALYAYFLNYPHDELPYLKIPLHTVVKLTFKAYGCIEERFKVDVPAVDTHRGKSSPIRATLPESLPAPPSSLKNVVDDHKKELEEEKATRS